jgi:hypothetical protein
LDGLGQISQGLNQWPTCIAGKGRQARAQASDFLHLEGAILVPSLWIRVNSAAGKRINPVLDVFGVLHLQEVDPDSRPLLRRVFKSADDQNSLSEGIVNILCGTKAGLALKTALLAKLLGLAH